MKPIRYEACVETVQPGEQETFAELSRIFEHVQENVVRRESSARRATHAKATAFLKGELVIPAELPPELAQGLFSRPGRHEVLVRFSQGPSSDITDKASGQRGLAIKVLGVEGPHVAGSRETTTQDWVFGVHDAAFTDGSAQAFLRGFRPIGASLPLCQMAWSSRPRAWRARRKRRLRPSGLEPPTCASSASRPPIRQAIPITAKRRCGTATISRSSRRLQARRRLRPSAIRRSIRATTTTSSGTR